MVGLLAKTITVSAVLGVLVTGCSGSVGTPTAQSATPTRSGSSSASPVPGSGSPTPSGSAATTVPTPNATVTGLAGITGTATDFCSAIAELATGISASRSSKDAVSAIYVSVADWRRFAPDSMKTQVKSVGDELLGVAQNLAVGLYSSTQALSDAVQAALTSPDGRAIGQYSVAHCH